MAERRKQSKATRTRKQFRSTVYKSKTASKRKRIKKFHKRNSRPIVIYTDGSYVKHSDAGGWAYIAIYPDGERVIDSGSAKGQSAVRMEMIAAIEALKAVGCHDCIHLYTDCLELRHGAISFCGKERRRIYGDAFTSGVENIDLWRELDLHNNLQSVKWCWIKGHSGDVGNHIADTLAISARMDLEKKINQTEDI